MFSVPADWPDGDYVAYLEINTEGDYNAHYNATATRRRDARTCRTGTRGR